MNKIKSLFLGKYRFYAISTSVLVVWMFLLDTNDLSVQWRLWNELRELKAQKIYYQEQLKALEKEKKALVGHPALLEKLAREKYLMRRPKEDIYILVNKENRGIEDPQPEK